MSMTRSPSLGLKKTVNLKKVFDRLRKYSLRLHPKKKAGRVLVLCQVSYSGSLSAEDKSKSTCKRQRNYRHAGTKDRERNLGFFGQATIHQQVHCPAHTHL